MEILKKRFKLITTTASTICDGGIDGPCYEILPDTGVTYSMKILLNTNDIDFGFFDVITGTTGITSNTTTNIVTGVTSSRLSELRKFKSTGTLSDLYFISTDPSIDGVNDILTNTGTSWTYYIGGITYLYDVSSNITTFSFESSNYNDLNNFNNLKFYKDESKENIIDKPEINNNVFIIRQSLSVFQNIYRLQTIRSLSDLEKYAGGAKFNIVNNS